MERQCTVELKHNTPLWVCADGVRTCWASGDKSDSTDRWDCTEADCSFTTTDINDLNYNYCGGMICPNCGSSDIHYYLDTGEKNRSLIERVGNKFKHSSTLEHLYYNFHVKDISRACLQELARHRIASLSVKSTRYTLKELKEEEQFNDFANELDYKRASKYVVWTGHHNTDITIFFMLEDLRALIKEGVSNDIAKYSLPEAYKTELAWSINARSLQNFLTLRSNKAALWEIRELASAVFEALPEEHKYLFENCLYKEKEN
jgi:thymidylate synthase (FAD)